MRVLIIGATSAIAKATARLYAGQSASIYLVGRNEQALTDIESDLKTRGASSVAFGVADLAETDCQGWIDKAFEQLSGVDVVLVAHGVLGDQKKAEADLAYLQSIYQVNSLAKVCMLSVIANKLEEQGSGTLAVISSVAGDRGRPSNYVYGSSKAMVTSFLQGLRARLAKVNVHVLTIKPGFVDTPMTADFDKGGPLWVQPEDIAKGIILAINKKKNVAYLPWFWRFIMAIIIHIPEPIFKKLNL